MSNRSIPLSKMAVAALDAQRALLVLERAGKAYQPSDFIFPAETGQPAKERNVQRALDGILSALKLPHYSLHNLRHTYGTQLAIKGVPVHITRALLGHEKITTTLAIYNIALPNDLSAGAMAIDDAVSA